MVSAVDANASVRKLKMVWNPLTFVRGILLVAILPFFNLPPVLAASPTEEAIAASDAWQAILFYSKRNLRQDSSIVDGDEFFLAPNGKTDPLAELIATIQLFDAKESLPLSDESGPCSFPARYDFLKKALGRYRHDVYDCPWIRNYVTAVSPVGVSLVFSSFYINNPSSMMGHTLIRYHRQAKAGRMNSIFFDHVVNFAATPTTSNQLLYAFSGISGLFPGTFSLSPYYFKITEYVNFESRDIWDYELDLTPSELRQMFLATLEGGRHRIDYFYADENCSYLMLFFLDIARPSLKLRHHFSGIVTPSDTLKVVHDAGITKSISYLPSQREKFRHLYGRLSAVEKSVLRQLLDAGPALTSAAPWTSLSPREQTAVLDAGLEYIAYSEKLVGERQPLEFAALYRHLLALRVKAEPLPLEPVPVPPDMEPHLTHFSKRLTAAYLRRSYQHEMVEEFSAIGLRPSFHDAISPGGGFPRGLGIELGRLLVSKPKDSSGLRLENFHLVEINSVQALSFDNRVPSWRLALGYAREPVIEKGVPQFDDVYSFRTGLGLTTEFANESFLLSLFVLPDVSWVESEGMKTKIFAGPEILAYLGRSLAFHAYSRWGIDSDDSAQWLRRYGAVLKLGFQPGYELELLYQREEAGDELNVGAHVFF